MKEYRNKRTGEIIGAVQWTDSNEQEVIDLYGGPDQALMVIAISDARPNDWLISGESCYALTPEAFEQAYEVIDV